MMGRRFVDVLATLLIASLVMVVAVLILAANA